MQMAVQVLVDPQQVSALAHPLRLQILAALREPDTAAGVARSLGRSRQSLSYHFKELERVELLQHSGERRKGNFMEQLYQATARRFVVSASFAADPERLTQIFRDQVSLAQLAGLGERLQRDAAALIEIAGADGVQIPSVSVDSEVCFSDERARAAFLSEYVDLLTNLLAKHGGADGEPYRVTLAAYPNLEK